MTTVTLTFQRRVGSPLALTDATSVLLSDTTGTFGVKRTDTGAIVVADGTPMVRASQGVYAYSFLAPSPGLEYTWSAEVLANGNTSWQERTQTEDIGSTSIGWHYADYDAVAGILGQTDLKIIDDPDNDGVENFDLVQAAGNYADAYMNARFKAFGFNTPLASTDAGTDLLLRDISAKLVIAQLNRSRALVVVSRNNTVQISGIDKVVGQWEREANSMIVSLATGFMANPATRTNAGPSAAVPAFTGATYAPMYYPPIRIW